MQNKFLQPTTTACIKEGDLDIVLKIYTCDDCKIPFKKKHLLELHMNSVHLNYRPYMCNPLQKVFLLKIAIKNSYGGHSQRKNKIRFSNINV